MLDFIFNTPVILLDCSISDEEIDNEGTFVDPNETDESGKNALRIAIENGSPIDLIIKLLDR